MDINEYMRDKVDLARVLVEMNPKRDFNLCLREEVLGDLRNAIIDNAVKIEQVAGLILASN